jgi:hypothetical protein
MKHSHTEQIVALALLGLITLAACVDEQEQDLELKHHCEMVGIYRETDGQYGWPDYNNTAGDCPKEK